MINRYFQEEQRPLFTIAVLVSGVVGGLAVVIAVVYLYRFCLKKRPPVTTTGIPEAKREQIRSNASSQSRPLPLPLSADSTTPFLASTPSKEYTVSKRFFSNQRFKERDRCRTRIEFWFSYSNSTAFLSVSDGPHRAQSADMLQVDANSEIRRASFDVPRGTGRQLPSTEGLEVRLKLFLKVPYLSPSIITCSFCDYDFNFEILNR
ncbi:unnamed protein product [Strongylus vulgaris]|uniref:Uncharacterized protein n=1 Tax=Strongylus vulgaris TaxID=40348 RepID=A0A3P7K8H3_STRVU|nr:unnamed protein product [Strongylus vulgaris]